MSYSIRSGTDLLCMADVDREVGTDDMSQVCTCFIGIPVQGVPAGLNVESSHESSGFG